MMDDEADAVDLLVGRSAGKMGTVAYKDGRTPRDPAVYD
jgi:hypothetical protein